MTCQICQEKMAIIHVVDKAVDGVWKDTHICGDCAEGFDKAFIVEDSVIEGVMEDVRTSTLVCPKCGITWRDILDTGKLGCPIDYELFGDLLQWSLKQMHGSTEHVGKKPKKKTGFEKVVKLLDQEEELKRRLRRKS